MFAAYRAWSEMVKMPLPLHRGRGARQQCASAAARTCWAEPLEGRVLLAFGVTTTATSYVVDTGADVKFTVLRAGATTSTIHLGDLTSVTYKGSEVLAPYSTTSRYSHYEQGLSSSAVISATTDPA